MYSAGGFSKFASNLEKIINVGGSFHNMKSYMDDSIPNLVKKLRLFMEEYSIDQHSDLLEVKDFYKEEKILTDNIEEFERVPAETLNDIILELRKLSEFMEKCEKSLNKLAKVLKKFPGVDSFKAQDVILDLNSEAIINDRFISEGVDCGDWVIYKSMRRLRKNEEDKFFAGKKIISNKNYELDKHNELDKHSSIDDREGSEFLEIVIFGRVFSLINLDSAKEGKGAYKHVVGQLQQFVKGVELNMSELKNNMTKGDTLYDFFYRLGFNNSHGVDKFLSPPEDLCAKSDSVLSSGSTSLKGKSISNEGDEALCPDDELCLDNGVSDSVCSSDDELYSDDGVSDSVCSSDDELYSGGCGNLTPCQPRYLNEIHKDNDDDPYTEL